jgi:hypothetical protein
VNSPPPKPEVILTNFFAEPTVLLVPITSRDISVNIIFDWSFFYHNCHSMPMKNMLFYVKSSSLFDTFLKYLFNIIQVSSVVSYKYN